jgi:N-acetylglucosaminyldiphosphoundecaprenol N-acetyl-beta-D-mannosaminyltransferase
MPIAAAIAALAAIVWSVVVARRGSLLAGCAIFLVVGYVLGPDFWHQRIGPLPLTLDRLVLAGLLASVAVQWRMGRFNLRGIRGTDWLVCGLVALLGASALFGGSPELVTNEHSAWGRWFTAFVVPAILYGVARWTPMTGRQWKRLLACLVMLGVYLAITALFESFELWSLVFPRYIADPNLGIHFGRARGPGLNGASLGLYLTACGCCAWMLLLFVSHRWQQLALFVSLPLFAFGVFATYTRSTWLGLAASGLVIAAMQIPRRLRLPALAAASLAGLLVVGIAWSNLVGLKREGSAAEAEHSVDQRTSFAYVSWQMFQDHPILGVGFGGFYYGKLPYLSDRSQPIELESIRPLHHHNTLLSLLTETGIVGFAAYAALLIAWCRSAWKLAANDGSSPQWLRSHGVLMIALVSNYLCSALFHDLTFVPSQHWLLFMFAGVTLNLQSQFRTGSSRATSFVAKVRNAPSAPRRPQTTAAKAKWPGPAQSVRLFGMELSPVTMREAVDQILNWCHAPEGAACRYVVTPNVDHAVLFDRRADLRAAYAEASLVLADGAPIVLASRLLAGRQRQRHLPERVAGSDLVPRLFAAAQQPLRVFLLGAAPGVGESAAARIQRRWPHVEVVGTYSPPLGFEHDDAETARILTAIAAAGPDLLVVGLGAPKQELWVHRQHRHLSANVALCVGATIDFLAGKKRRSPVWMRRAGLEWAHRVMTEPRRLAGRYARDAWVFPQLVWREIVEVKSLESRVKSW